MKDEISTLLIQFTSITTGSTIAAAVSISLISPDAHLTVAILWQILLLSFLTACLKFIFYSKKEMGRKQWIIRTIIHYIAVNALLIIGGRKFEWLDMQDNKNIIFFILLVTVVYIVIVVTCCIRDKKLSRTMNAAIINYTLKKNKEEKENNR